MTTAKEQAQAQQTPPASGAEEQTQSSELALSQLIDQQIAQAIRPVLDEFRQQMAQELEQRAAAIAAASAGGQKAATEAPPSPVEQADGQQPAGQTAQQAEAELPQEAKPGEAAGQVGVQRPVTEVLRPGLKAVEQQVEPVLHSAVTTVVTALLAETTHIAIQQQAELGLHVLLQRLFDALPDSMNKQEMQAKTERLIQSILREFLDVVFAETMRTTAQQKTQRAIQASFQGDLGGAVRETGDMLKPITDALIEVLRRNLPNLVRLALALALLALAGSIAQSGAKSENKEE